MRQIGTERKPIVLRVQTMARAEEILARCELKGVKAVVGVEPDKPEDITDLEKKTSPSSLVVAPLRVGRNDYCPCGSGRKYKKCCLNMVN